MIDGRYGSAIVENTLINVFTRQDSLTNVEYSPMFQWSEIIVMTLETGCTS